MTTYNQIKHLYISNGYKFREEFMALNVGALRSRNSQSDKFDDTGWCAWVDENGSNLLLFAVTTDPGKHWLLTPIKKEGCIIVVPGQYLEVYTKGLHNGKYECFKQAGSMYYVRDYNKDTILDFDLYRNPESLKIRGFWGVYATNLHRASEFKIVKWIQNYSAGCQVVQDPEKYKQLIGLRDKSALAGFSRWDYTLFEEG